MRTLKHFFAVAAVLVAAVPAAMAQDATAEGAAIAAKGAGGAIPACNTCHADGAGEFPLLAGQMDFYIVNQLYDFKTGKRRSPVMEPIAKALSPAQIKSLAAHFASLPKKRAAQPVADEALIEKGRVLTTDGNVAKDIFPCDRCHGIGGRGADFAALAGQNPAYILAQVQALRASKRENDSLGIMEAIAQKLTDDDVKAAAAYYHQLVPAK